MNAKVLASKLFSKLHASWNNLTNPSRQLVALEDRRRAQITSSVLLAITFLCLGIEFFVVVKFRDQALIYPDVHLLIICGTVVSFIAYWISRTRFYLVSALLFLILIPTAICVGLIMRPIHFIPIVDYLLIGIMVSGMLFSIRLTLLVTVLYSMVTMLTMTFIAEQYQENVFFRLLFVFAGATTLVIFSHYRNLLEQDRKQIIEESDARIRRSNDMYRTLARNLPKATVFLFDHDLRFIIAQGYDIRPNRPFISAVEGKTIYDALPKPVADDLAPFYRAALNGEENEIERNYLGHHFALHYLPVRDAQGNIFAGMLLSQEITERKHAREALVEARDAAIRSARIKSEFMSNMSHEIRTPMSGLMGMLELLGETDLKETQREFLDFSNQSARRLLRIVDDILDFSKLEAGYVALETIPFDVEVLIEETAALFRQQANKKGIDLRVDIKPTVLPVVAGDPTRLRQVLVNLTSNALKFTQKGEITLAATLVSTNDDYALIRFEVRDTGVGIPLEHHGHIFKSFVQADNSTTRRYGGTGLGLAISKQLVELMGGHIEVQSEPDLGSTFAFTISLLLDQPKPLTFAGKAFTHLGDSSISPNGDFEPRILLAEDDELNIRLVTDALSVVECHLDVVRTGKEALNRVLQGDEYALILMDIHMPVMDGLEATRRIRVHEGGSRQTPIVALTASVLSQEQTMYYEAGMNGIIRKPYSVNELRANIMNWIKNQTKQGLAEQ